MLITVAMAGILVCSPALITSVSAHEEIEEESGTHSLTVHIDPDERPVAGEKATITYFLKSDFPERPFSAKLVVTGIDAKHYAEVEPRVTVEKITIDYTFPTEGRYKLELNIVQDDTNEAEVFSETVQVAGRKAEEAAHTEKSMSNTTKYSLLAANGVAAGLLLFVFIRSRKNKK